MGIIRELQLVELEMLKIFDEICTKHEIEYFVLFGTALGMVRHQGFIPWDDDVDVGMLRSDYEKLKKVPIDEWKGLLLVDGKTDCFYHEKVFPRVYKPGTVLELERWKKYIYNPQKIKKPIGMDIFLFDHVDSKKEAVRKGRLAQILHMQYYYSKYKAKVESDASVADKIRCLMKNGLHYLFLVGRKPENYIDSYYKLVEKTTGDYIICFDSWYMKTIMNSFALRDTFYPTRKMVFEGIELSAPNKIELFLKQNYGNYMTLPPQEERVAHIPTSIELGEKMCRDDSEDNR